MGQTCMLLGRHGTCMATAASCRGHMQVHKPWDMDMLGPRGQMPRRGVRGRLGSRNFVWLGPELVNMGKEGLSSSGRVPLLSSDPSLPTLQGSRFLLRSSSPRRRGGAGAQQGEGLYSRRYRQGVKAGKGVTGALGAEKAPKKES